MDIENHLEALKDETQNVQVDADNLESAVQYKIEDLETLKDSLGGIVTDIAVIVSQLEILPSTLQEYDDLKDTLNNQGIYAE